jgi:BlaI family transcriptional regulator, penicillinase repressor
MAVLQAVGSATVVDVRQRLADKLAYTAVLTVLRTLEEKGYVGHTGEGRADRSAHR